MNKPIFIKCSSTKAITTSCSFCETESNASQSQGTCTEDFFEEKHDLNYSKKKKKKKKQKHFQASENTSKSVRPNYFVGIQVSNPEIHRAVVDIQKLLLAFDEKLSPSLIDVATLHLTLLVVHIETENDLYVACSALDQVGASLSRRLANPPLNLKFEEVSHFSNQVLYAKLVENEHYHRLVSAASEVREKFSEMGVTLPDKKGLVPHLTVAKLSKVPRGKGKLGIRKIDPSSYEELKDICLGEQLIVGLQLLSMNKSKDSFRYYHCDREVLFDVIPKESLDHSRCCFPRQPVIPKFFHRKFCTVPVSASTASLLSKLHNPLSHRPFGVSVVFGCAAVLSIAFAAFKWVKKPPIGTPNQVHAIPGVLGSKNWASGALWRVLEKADRLMHMQSPRFVFGYANPK